jgi:hypothetical protein
MMDRNEKLKFIDVELKGLWPEWDPTEAELRVWLGILGRYDYDVAQVAVQQYFSEQAGNYRRPKPAKFVEKVRLILQRCSSGVRDSSPTLTTNVYIECLEPPERNPNLIGASLPVFVLPTSKQDDLDYVLACAETMRKRFEHLYSGKWITRQTNPPEHSGLYGEAARQKSFEDILSGPDTKTKRWLQNYLDTEKKQNGQKDRNQPVPVGAVLGNGIPF